MVPRIENPSITALRRVATNRLALIVGKIVHDPTLEANFDRLYGADVTDEKLQRLGKEALQSLTNVEHEAKTVGYR